MNITLYNKIAYSSGCRDSREEVANMVLNDKSLLSDLVHVALDTTDKHHHRACWILELVCEAKITWLKEYLPRFCSKLSYLKNESAIRPMGKICLFAVKQNDKNSGFISEEALQQITEVCFDWLITPNRKVGAKYYAIHTLYILGKNNNWIYPELRPILEQGFNEHTAAYKIAARDILRKIDSAKNRH